MPRHTHSPQLLSALSHHSAQLASSCKSTALFLYHFLHNHGVFHCTLTVPKVTACCCGWIPLHPPWYAICVTWFEQRLHIIQQIWTDHRGLAPWVLSLFTKWVWRGLEVCTETCRHIQYVCRQWQAHTHTHFYTEVYKCLWLWGWAKISTILWTDSTFSKWTLILPSQKHHIASVHTDRLLTLTSQVCLLSLTTRTPPLIQAYTDNKGVKNKPDP